MKVDKYCVLPNTKLTDALQIIDENRGSDLFIVDEHRKLIGVVSDGDIRRWIINGGDTTVDINLLMNSYPLYIYEGYESDAKRIIKEEEVRAVPIIDRDGIITNVIFDDKLNKNSEVKRKSLTNVSVVIMAGGKGTRLYPYTKILPKPLIPIGEIPIVERVIDEFYGYGVRKIYMTVNYKKNMIRSYFSESEKSYEIEYVEEDKPLGTAGSLKLIENIKDDVLFVANCDSIIRTDFVSLYEEHTSKKNDITIVAAVKNERIPYGVLTTNSVGNLETLEEKPLKSYLINTGMYVINPKVIELIPFGEMFHMTDLIEISKNSNYKIGVYPVAEDAFLDMGEFAEMKRMEEKLDLV